MQRHGRAELLDDRRSGEHISRREVGSPEHRRIDPTVSGIEEHSAYVGLRAAWLAVAGLSSTQGGPRNRADAGHPEVDPLHGLSRVPAERVTVELLMCLVERVRDDGGEGLVHRAVGCGNADLECLADIAEVGAALV